MGTRERTANDPAPASGGGSGMPPGQLARIRSEGERLLAAGSEAIHRALARDTEEFLRQNQQVSGE